MLFRSFFIIALSVLASCAVVKTPPSKKPLDINQLNTLSCEAGLPLLQQQIVSANVQDAQLHPISGSPYLGINRFLLSVVSQLATPEQKQAWLAELLAINQTKWQVELTNLTGQTNHPWHQYATTCLTQLVNQQLSNQDFFSVLEQMPPPNEYQQWAQIAGVYPVTQYFLVPGIQKWHADVHKQFNRPLLGSMRLYSPGQYSPTQNSVNRQPADNPPPLNQLSPNQLKRWLGEATLKHPLKLPQLPAKQLAQVVQQFAPHWAIQQRGIFDLPGTPVWQNDQWQITTDQATVYWLPSYATVQGKHLLQLSYIIWFKERPANHWFDILAGNIDGVVWRVTLDTDGTPLLYDSIHSCGCYHTFIPASPRLIAKSTTGQLEPPLIINKTRSENTTSDKAPLFSQPTVVALNSVDHWVLGLERMSVTPSQTYQLEPYNNLRSLQAAPQLKKSFYDNTGFVKGTERPERWLFWPSGVPSAGAMRQWGHHATAFIGERYFDDPALIEKIFKYTP